MKVADAAGVVGIYCLSMFDEVWKQISVCGQGLFSSDYYDGDVYCRGKWCHYILKNLLLDKVQLEIYNWTVSPPSLKSWRRTMMLSQTIILVDLIIRLNSIMKYIR